MHLCFDVIGYVDGYWQPMCIHKLRRMAGSVVLFPSYYAAYCPYLRHLKIIMFDLKHNVLRRFEAGEKISCFC